MKTKTSLSTEYYYLEIGHEDKNILKLAVLVYSENANIDEEKFGSPVKKMTSSELNEFEGIDTYTVKIDTAARRWTRTLKYGKSELTVCDEHAEGIVIKLDDAKKLGLINEEETY